METYVHQPGCGTSRAIFCCGSFKDAGFVWGGVWADHPDPMHFE
ncbi:MAG: M15 family metallopeptidase [Chloroflexota bacterium]